MNKKSVKIIKRGAIALLVLFLSACSTIQKQSKMTITDKIKYQGTIYTKMRGYQEYEFLEYTDLNDDGKNEAVVRFRIEDIEGARNLTAVFNSANGKNDLSALIIRLGTPVALEFADIDGDGGQEIILYDHSGNHYTTLSIYTWKKDKLIKLFDNGTACYICNIDTKNKPARISVGRENWDYKYFCYANSDKTSLIEVWEWNGKAFEFNRHSSTTVAVSEEEAANKYVEKIQSYLQNTKSREEK